MPLMKRNNILTFVAFLSLVVLLVIELATHYDSYSRQVALSVTNIVGGGVYLIVFLKLKKRGIILPWIASWLVAMSIWADAMGNFLHLFGDILWWDKLAHGVSSIAPAVVVWIILYELDKRGLIFMPVWLRHLVTVALVVLLSVLYEISEFVGDSFFPTHRVTDLFDTADDLMWNLLGTIIGVIIAVLWKKNRHRVDFDKQS